MFLPIWGSRSLHYTTSKYGQLFATRRNIPADLSLHENSCDNVKPGMKNAMFFERNCTEILNVFVDYGCLLFIRFGRFCSILSPRILIAAVVLIGRVQSKKNMWTLNFLALVSLWSPRNLSQRRWEFEGKNTDRLPDTGYFAVNVVTSKKKIFVWC